MPDEIEAPDDPPTWPGDDETRIDDPEFERQCMAEVARSGILKDWQIGRRLVTRSDKWGLVLRIDYRSPEARTGKHRLICWRSSSSEPLHQCHCWGLSTGPHDEWLPYQPV